MTGDVIPLGVRLKKRRQELGLSQTQAAQQLDVARTAYRLWEMEAARPSPDRWRVIAKWLGVSMTALLLAGELIDEQEAVSAQRIAQGAGLTSEEWDAESDAPAGDYFSQERAMIAEQALSGRISAAEGARLRDVVMRMQQAMGDGTHRWHPGRFVKRLPNAEFAPGLARAALEATAHGIPQETFEDAALLTSELVTNAVQHSGSPWIEVGITLDTSCLRIQVSDTGRQPIRPRTPSVDAGLGMTLVGELATRWGAERNSVGKTVWVELDLDPVPL